MNLGVSYEGYNLDLQLTSWRLNTSVKLLASGSILCIHSNTKLTVILIQAYEHKAYAQYFQNKVYSHTVGIASSTSSSIHTFDSYIQ